STVLTTANTNSIRFVPKPDYIGNADISFRAWDSTDGSVNGGTAVNATLRGGTQAFSVNLGTTEILVNNIPDIEINDQLVLNPNQSKRITSTFLQTIDLDNGTNPLIYQVTTVPSQGSLLVGGTATNTFTQADINDNLVTYKHTQPGIFTDDSFKFTVRDADGGRRSDTFAIRVNDPPVVNNSKALFSAIANNTPVTQENLLYVDSDGSTLPGTLQYQLTDLPDNGQLLLNGKALALSSKFTQANINNNQVTYQATTSGADSFSYTVRDIDGGTTTGSISIDVNAPPKLGTTSDLLVQEDIPEILGITTPTDPDGDSFSLTINTIPDPEYGYVAFSSTSNPLQVNATITPQQLVNLVFVPKADVFGQAGSFQYTANDGRLAGTSTQVIAINIAPVNDAPVANPDGPVYVSSGKTVSIDVLANDTDIEGDTLSLSAVSPEPKAGIFLETAPLIKYRPFTDITEDSLEAFTYDVSDGTATSIGDLTIQSLIIRATDDNIVGDAWHDHIAGGDGNDTIDLKAGNDVLEGGLGNDCLVGGIGNDTFVYTTSLDGGVSFDAINNTAIQTAIALNNYDQIIGFESFGATGGDVIQISRSMIITNQSSAIISAVQSDVNGNVLSLTVPALFVYEFQGSSYLIYDSNGDNTSGNNSVILGKLNDISGVITIDPNDFTII
ncbi:MAG: cadherin-like domain-containing protein, partial [Microcoleaceae cyanobacterium]